MLTTIILLSFIAAAFWREAIKLAVAAIIVIMLLGIVQLVRIADEAGLVPPDPASIGGER